MPSPQGCKWLYLRRGENANPAKHLLVGHCGGPDAQNFVDDVNLFQHTEVAIDYNAAFVGARSCIKYYGDFTHLSQLPPEPDPDLIWHDLGM